MKLVLFILFNLPILWISRDCLKDPKKHGFFRFFAFEGTLLLFLYNMDQWFKNPFSLLQLFSWLFLIVSLCLVIYGFYLLRKKGEPRGSFENTTQLVNIGIYRYIRHPMYASVLYLGIGIFLKFVTLTSMGLILGICVFLYLSARAEEEENIMHFGQSYREYMKRTRMFIPWIY